jgi:hypothetical protein
VSTLPRDSDLTCGTSRGPRGRERAMRRRTGTSYVQRSTANWWLRGKRCARLASRRPSTSRQQRLRPRRSTTDPPKSTSGSPARRSRRPDHRVARVARPLRPGALVLRPSSSWLRVEPDEHALPRAPGD